jgi:hypothetical protein
MTLPEFRSETPTQFDLARWLFERILTDFDHKIQTKAEALALMSDCMNVIRPEPRTKNGKAETP